MNENKWLARIIDNELSLIKHKRKNVWAKVSWSAKLMESVDSKFAKVIVRKKQTWRNGRTNGKRSNFG